MTDKDLLVNKHSQVTIQRGKHNKENPYVMLSKKMLQDSDIRPATKGILCYLLSLPDNWQTHPRQIARALCVGHDMVYNALKDLLYSGYALKKVSKAEKGQFGSVIYEFYEEKLPECDRYKEKSTVSGNPDTVKPDTENPTLQNIYSTDHTSTDNKSSLKVPADEPAEAESADAAEVISNDPQKPRRVRTPADFSPKIREVGEQMLNCLVRSKPNYVPPRSLAPFLTHVDYLLRLDKRDPKLIIDVFSWALADHFWADKMYKPNPAEYLRKQFDQLEMKMNAKPAPKDRKFAPSSNDAEALKKMEDMARRAI